MFKPRSPENIYSEANLITLVRLIGSLIFFTLAAIEKNPLYNFIGLGIHWIGDVADGFWARFFKQETVLGAEIDIIADRVEIIFFYINFLFFRPYLFLPIVIYLINFVFIDFYLSYQFLKFGLISPNYFYKVDRKVYFLNYSPGAKFINSTVVALILIFFPRCQLAATLIALGLIFIKLYSFKRLNNKLNSDKNTCP
ncbi:MAG: CDP-alcohol phosphatidyltransferase family protein [Acidobacteriota bacterium]